MDTNFTIFDTHAFVKRLITVGFTEEQAEVFAETQSGLIEQQVAVKRDILALKRDMQGSGNGLSRDMKEIEANLRCGMKELGANLTQGLKELEMRLLHHLTWRLGGIMVAGIAIAAILAKKL